METNLTFKTNWINSLSFKLVIIAILALLLLIPLGMIKQIIRERESTAQGVENDISNQWGFAQTLVGPMLSVPVEQTLADKNGTTYIEKSWLHIMPSNLNVITQIDPEIRYRGIYKTAVYNSVSTIDGDFILPQNTNDIDGFIDWEKAQLTFGISDNRGIRGQIDVKWNETPLVTQAGMVTKQIAQSGFSAKVPLDSEATTIPYKFSINLNLSGSKSFSVLPIGQNSTIKLASTWNDPSFNGSQLPQEREISEKGFEAKWTLTHLNRNYPQYWLNKQFDVWEHQLGVDLFLPVNHYQKAFRSAKYGILFIALTMLVFIFMEFNKNKKVHLFHYLLVGLALVLFFSVLTALSEHLGFNLAYLAASTVNIALIGMFSFGLLRDIKLTTWVVTLLTILYAFLFVLLQLNDYAFLAGNIGLIVALGFIMKASLKIIPNHNE